MTKQQYLHQLRRHLAGRISESELFNVLDYYDEYFDEAGADEAATAAALGDPQTLAAQIIEQHGGAQPVVKKRRWLPITAAVLGVALLCGAALFWGLRKGAARPAENPAPPQTTVNAPVDPPAAAPADVPVGSSGQIDTDIDAVHTIDIKAGYADIEIVEGRSWHLTLTWPEEALALEYACEDGILTISSVQQSPHIHTVPVMPTVVITIPDDRPLTQLTAATALGNVTLREVEANAAQLHAALGDVTLRDCDIGTLGCDLSMGEFSAEELEGSELRAIIASGSATLRDCEYGTMELQLSLGSALLTDLPELREYGEVELSTGAGQVSVNAHDHAVSYDLIGSGHRTLYITVGFGDIDAHFDD